MFLKLWTSIAKNPKMTTFYIDRFVPHSLKYFFSEKSRNIQQSVTFECRLFRNNEDKRWIWLYFLSWCWYLHGGWKSHVLVRLCTIASCSLHKRSLLWVSTIFISFFNFKSYKSHTHFGGVLLNQIDILETFKFARIYQNLRNLIRTASSKLT